MNCLFSLVSLFSVALSIVQAESLSLSMCSAARPIVDLAVIGGGPGGLAAALAVIRNSPPQHSIVVFERDSFEAKGAGVAISATGWEALKEIDQLVEERIRATGVPVTAATFESFDTPTTSRDKKSGLAALALLVRNVAKQIARRVSIFVDIVLVFLRIKKAAVAISYIHLWHDVRMELAKRLKEVCSSISSGNSSDVLRSGMTLVGFREAIAEESQESHFELEFANSANATEIVRARAVLACDGVSSTVRKLAPREPKADSIFISQGKSVWRGVTSNIDVDQKATFYRGDKNAVALVFPSGRPQTCSWSVIAPEMAGRALDSEDAKRRCKEALRAACPATTPPPDLIARAIAGSSRVVEHRLAVRDFDHPSGYGAVTSGLSFLGDAQHPGMWLWLCLIISLFVVVACSHYNCFLTVRPTGEGLALAWGDAAALGKAVRDAATATSTTTDSRISQSKSSWASILRVYERSREALVREISDKERANALATYTKSEPTDSIKADTSGIGSGRGSGSGSGS
jgi:2-polyprenyl-6-methoxyphenol hydroxylase-like FAD-dependent oxidoreductase